MPIQCETPDRKVRKKISKDDIRPLSHTALNSLGFESSLPRIGTPPTPVTPEYIALSARYPSPSSFDPVSISKASPPLPKRSSRRPQPLPLVLPTTASHANVVEINGDMARSPIKRTPISSTFSTIFEHDELRTSVSCDSVSVEEAESATEVASVAEIAPVATLPDPPEPIQLVKVESCTHGLSVGDTESVICPEMLSDSLAHGEANNCNPSLFDADFEGKLGNSHHYSPIISSSGCIHSPFLADSEPRIHASINTLCDEPDDSHHSPRSARHCKIDLRKTPEYAEDGELLILPANASEATPKRPVHSKSHDILNSPCSQASEYVESFDFLSSPGYQTTKYVNIPEKPSPKLHSSKSLFRLNNHKAHKSTSSPSRRQSPLSQSSAYPLLKPSSAASAGNCKPKKRPVLPARPSLQRLNTISPESSLSSSSPLRTTSSRDSPPTSLTSPMSSYDFQHNTHSSARQIRSAILTKNMEKDDRKESAQNIQSNGKTKKKTRLSRYIEKAVEKISAIGTSPVNHDPDTERKRF